MKKKLLFAAVVIGALSLGSCVDDNESASVEAVRNAKAEQLKSIAAMNNAQAEATRLLAAAESALKAAQAEAEKTQTELEKVLIDIKKVELEKAQLELKLQQDKYSQELQVALKQLENQLSNLENEKARLELQKAAIAKQLEIQEAELASQLLYAQTEVLNAQQQLLNRQNQMEAAEKAKLQQLVTTYSNAIATLNSSKQYLFTLQSNLTRAENNLATYKELRTDLLEANQKQIATDEAQIASYKKYSNYLSNYDELVAEYNAKSLSYNEAIDKLNALRNTYNQLSSNTSAPSMNAVSQSAFILAYYDFGYRVGLYSAPYSDVGTTIEKTVGNRTLRFYMEKYEPITLNTERLSTYIPQYEQNIKSAKSTLESVTTTYNNYAKAAEDAKKAWDDAKAATPPDDAEITRLAESYRIALESFENYKTTLTWAQEYVAQQEKNLSDLKVLMSTEAYTQFTTLLSEYNQAIVETYKPVADAYFAYRTHFYQEYIPIQEAYISLSNILYDNSNGGSLMTASQIESLIKGLESRIEALKENQSYISNITSAEQLIEILKSNIEAAKAEVSVNQKYADDAKVALDAAMAE
jgi:hypothetical protein